MTGNPCAAVSDEATSSPDQEQYQYEEQVLELFEIMEPQQQEVLSPWRTFCIALVFGITFYSVCFLVYFLFYA